MQCPCPLGKPGEFLSVCWVISNRLGSFFLNAQAPYKECVLTEVRKRERRGKENAAQADTKLTSASEFLKFLWGGNSNIPGLLSLGSLQALRSSLHHPASRRLPLLVHSSNTRVEILGS